MVAILLIIVVFGLIFGVSIIAGAISGFRQGLKDQREIFGKK